MLIGQPKSNSMFFDCFSSSIIILELLFIFFLYFVKKNCFYSFICLYVEVFCIKKTHKLKWALLTISKNYNFLINFEAF